MQRLMILSELEIPTNRVKDYRMKQLKHATANQKFRAFNF